MRYLLISLIASATFVHAEDVRLDNLEPHEAQQLIEGKDQSLEYAPKIDTNVPAVRYLGNEPHHVVEDVYLANQYHGQDGLGGYLYGYAVPDIAKTEKKKAGGDLRGAYNYVNGQGQEIKVEYWDDGTGFHQVDNVPKILPKQIPDTPEVQAAKDEHARIWREQAERNSKPVAYPYQNGGYKPEIAAQIAAGQQQHGQQPGQYGQQQGQYGQQQGQQQGQYGQQQGQQPGQYGQQQGQQPGQYGQQQGQQPGQYGQQQGQYSQQHGQALGQPQGQYGQQQGQYGQGQGERGQYQEGKSNRLDGGSGKDEEEESGPPRGFFYNFDYPVGIIVGKEGNQLQKRDLQELYGRNKEILESLLRRGSSSGAKSPNYFVAA